MRTTSDPLMSQSACLEEVQLTNIKPGEGLVRNAGRSSSSISSSLWVCRPGMHAMCVKLGPSHLSGSIMFWLKPLIMFLGFFFAAGDVHQVYLWWVTCHHRNHRACKYDCMLTTRIHSALFSARFKMKQERWVVVQIEAVGHHVVFVPHSEQKAYDIHGEGTSCASSSSSSSSAEGTLSYLKESRTAHP